MLGGLEGVWGSKRAVVPPAGWERAGTEAETFGPAGALGSVSGSAEAVAAEAVTAAVSEEWAVQAVGSPQWDCYG